MYTVKGCKWYTLPKFNITPWNMMVGRLLVLSFWDPVKSSSGELLNFQGGINLVPNMKSHGLGGLQFTARRIIMWGFPYQKKTHLLTPKCGYQGGRAQTSSSQNLNPLGRSLVRFVRARYTSWGLKKKILSRDISPDHFLFSHLEFFWKKANQWNKK